MLVEEKKPKSWSEASEKTSASRTFPSFPPGEAWKRSEWNGRPFVVQPHVKIQYGLVEPVSFEPEIGVTGIEGMDGTLVAPGVGMAIGGTELSPPTFFGSTFLGSIGFGVSFMGTGAGTTTAPEAAPHDEQVSQAGAQSLLCLNLALILSSRFGRGAAHESQAGAQVGAGAHFGAGADFSQQVGAGALQDLDLWQQPSRLLILSKRLGLLAQGSQDAAQPVLQPAIAAGATGWTWAGESAPAMNVDDINRRAAFTVRVLLSGRKFGWNRSRPGVRSSVKCVPPSRSGMRLGPKFHF